MVLFLGEIMGKIKGYYRKIKNLIKSALKEENKVVIRWVYGYVKPNLLFIIIYTLFGLSGTVVSLISSLVSKDLVDVITTHRTGELLTTFLAMIGITLLSSFMGQLSSYLSVKVSLKLENRIKTDVYEKIMTSQWEELANYQSGDLQMRWNSDSSSVASGLLNLFPNFVVYLFRFVAALYMVIIYDPSFAIFALISIPISIFTSRESMRRMQKSNMSTMEVNTRLYSFNYESFANLQTVKAFDMLETYIKKLNMLQHEYLQVRLKFQKIQIKNSIILLLVSMLVMYSAQGWGIYKVWSGAITYGTMTMFLSLSTTLTSTVDSLIGLFPSSIGFFTATKRLMAVTEMPKEEYSNKEEVKQFYEVHKEDGVGLCIRDVTYGYRGADDIFIKADVDAHPHEVIAFVGPSGEGKTTMLRFLLALVKAREGKGYICAGKSVPEDGNCLELNAAVRQLVAYVPQGNTMFSGTIADNMRNVKEDATDEEIIDALKMACAWKFVEKLPDGINSEIKERGGGFSEGQSQRLSIARALLRKSPILLLDEATSALDIWTEKEVIKNIMADDYPRTCIVTTHRPTILNQCSRVYAIREKECVTLGKNDIKQLIEEYI